ncbi:MULTISPECIES: hypothetical protein [Bacillus cereus group]|uniref:hypothetical protein n=1 Tax=Bacillus cereus group TaxID=86661 RepID=UPI0020D265E3|nr:hypothetical protein [Bacillus thuringiensis]
MKEIAELQDRLRNEMVTRMDDADIVDILVVLQSAEKEIERLKGENSTEQKSKECYQCEGKGIGLDWGAMSFWECDVCNGTGEIDSEEN